jgi:hypothetical protein
MSPEEMIALVMAGDERCFGQELYGAFRKGFPIENLRPMLRSSDPEILGFGSYLVYELGARARGVIDDIVPLLESEYPQVRSDAMIALMGCATRFEGTALGKIICLLDDPDPFVQRGAMRFVQNCEDSQLAAGVFHASRHNPGTVFEDLPPFLGMKWPGHGNISVKGMAKLLSHESPVAKRFGVGLAARPRMVVDDSLLEIAYKYDDEECRCVLDNARSRPTPVGAVVMRLQQRVRPDFRIGVPLRPFSRSRRTVRARRGLPGRWRRR